MSVIFFCADLSTFSYLKFARDSFGGVHKQYGPKTERGRLFYPMYVVTWFIVAGVALKLLSPQSLKPLSSLALKPLSLQPLKPKGPQAHLPSNPQALKPSSSAQKPSNP